MIGVFTTYRFSGDRGIVVETEQHDQSREELLAMLARKRNEAKALGHAVSLVDERGNNIRPENSK